MRIASFEEKEWIDARTDRVPMEQYEVLVSSRLKSGKQMITKGEYFPEMKRWWNELAGGEVEAWMPLPDPYDGGQE